MVYFAAVGFAFWIWALVVVLVFGWAFVVFCFVLVCYLFGLSSLSFAIDSVSLLLYCCFLLCLFLLSIWFFVFSGFCLVYFSSDVVWICLDLFFCFCVWFGFVSLRCFFCFLGCFGFIVFCAFGGLGLLVAFCIDACVWFCLAIV